MKCPTCKKSMTQMSGWFCGPATWECISCSKPKQAAVTSSRFITRTTQPYPELIDTQNNKVWIRANNVYTRGLVPGFRSLHNTMHNTDFRIPLRLDLLYLSQTCPMDIIQSFVKAPIDKVWAYELVPFTNNGYVVSLVEKKEYQEDIDTYFSVLLVRDGQ